MLNILFLVKKAAPITLADYYISESGDDNNSGSMGAPFKTINKVNEVIDSNKIIAFEKGGTYYGYINTSGSVNVEITSYGVGNKPILRLAEIVNLGITQNGNIWSYHSDTLPVEINNLFVDGVKQTVATSNFIACTSGWIDSITANSLTDADGYWDQCEVVYSPYKFFNSKARISTYSSKVFHFTAQEEYALNGGRNFMIRNHVNLLTQNGQYAYNAATKTIYIYSTTVINEIIIPYSQTVGNVNNSSIFYFDNCESITLDGLQFDYSSHNHLSVFYSKDIIIKNCKFSNSGTSSIIAYDCRETGTYFHINDNEFLDLNDTAINTTLVFGLQILRNKINGVAQILGVARGAPPSDCGMFISTCYDVLIKYNDVQNVSGAGIFTQGCGKCYVDRNYVHACCLFLGDMGGIYNNMNTIAYTSQYSFLSHDVYIRNNIVLDMSRDGGIVWYSGGGVLDVQCIYIDYPSEYVEVSGNLITDCTLLVSMSGEDMIYYDNYSISSNSNGYSTIYNSYFTNGSYAGTYLIDAQIYNNWFINSKLSYGTEILILMGVIVPGVTANIHDNTYYEPCIASGNTSHCFRVDRQSGNNIYDLNGWTVTDEAISDFNRTNELISTVSMRKNTTGKAIENYLYKIINTENSSKSVQLSDLPYSDYIYLDGTTPEYPIVLPEMGDFKVLVRTEN